MDYKAELERRRQLGRKSQSAFRKRQAEARQAMIDENERLKSAIGAIASQVRPDDRPELRFSINEALGVAGLSPLAPGVDTQVLTPSSTNTWNSADSQVQHQVHSQPRKSPGSDLQEARQEPVPPTQHPTPRREPIHPDPFQLHRCEKGAAVVLPFLGSGAFTFAGLMFWHLVERYEVAPGPQTATGQLAVSPARPNINLTDLLQEFASFPQASSAFWVGEFEERMAARRAWLEGGSSSSSSSADAARGDGSVRGNDAVGTSSRRFLSIRDAEKRVRAIVGDPVFSFLAGSALDVWAAEGKRSDGLLKVRRQGDVISSLLDALSDTHVCFGDGPRWDMGAFDTVVRQWCLTLIGNGSEV